MIARDSILRRLHPSLDRKQSLFLDGIRHAAEILTFAHTRLRQTLTQIAVENPEGADADTLYTSAFLDAWALVDAIDRFRALWVLLPGASPPPPVPGVKSFQELSQPVRDLRNVADHLAQRADYVVACKGSALGVLTWFTFLKPETLEGVICTIVPGTLKKGSFPLANPAGQSLDFPTGLIHLAAGEHKANLSAIIPEVELRVRDLEAGLKRGLAQLGVDDKQAGADLLVKAFVSFQERPVPSDNVDGKRA